VRALGLRREGRREGGGKRRSGGWSKAGMDWTRGADIMRRSEKKGDSRGK